MRTDIKDIEQAVRELMDGIYMDCVYMDGVAVTVGYQVQTIDANPPESAGASVALYLGDERTWDVVAQRWRGGAPAAWLTFSILTDEPGRGTIAVYQHDGDDYTDVLDYIEIDTTWTDDEAAVIMVESETLYAGLHGATEDYVERVMLNGKAD